MPIAARAALPIELAPKKLNLISITQCLIMEYPA
jgi:hypothetical protein